VGTGAAFNFLKERLARGGIAGPGGRSSSQCHNEGYGWSPGCRVTITDRSAGPRAPAREGPHQGAWGLLTVRAGSVACIIETL